MVPSQCAPPPFLVLVSLLGSAEGHNSESFFSSRDGWLDLSNLNFFHGKGKASENFKQSLAEQEIVRM